MFEVHKVLVPLTSIRYSVYFEGPRIDALYHVDLHGALCHLTPSTEYAIQRVRIARSLS